MDICQIISKLLSTIAIQRIVLQVAIGMIGIEIRKDTDNLIDYQCLLSIFEGIKSPSKVEVARVELASKQGTQKLSTRLVVV